METQQDEIKGEKVLKPCIGKWECACVKSDEEYDSEPDRSNPAWKIQKDFLDEEAAGEVEEETKEEINIWSELMQEYEDMRLMWMQERTLAKPYEPPMPFGNSSATDYLNNRIFPILLPAIEETLHMAKEIDCLEYQKCVFNGLDHIAEVLWNKNPIHPSRHSQYLYIFDIPFVKLSLSLNPRPIYPWSWIWTVEEAIQVMQTYIRRYFVCREPRCTEMRDFWKIMRAEKERRQTNEEVEESVPTNTDHTDDTDPCHEKFLNLTNYM